MQRRKAFATAGAVSATALAAVVALGANFGLFGLTQNDSGPGSFKVVDATQVSRDPIVRTEVIDVAVPVTTPTTRRSAPPEHEHEEDD